MSFIYFAREMPDGPIKIGASNNPIHRVAVELQSGNPREIRVLVILQYFDVEVSGQRCQLRSVEREWHDRFAHLRIRGEWFRPEPELLAEVERHVRLARGRIGTRQVNAPVCTYADGSRE